MAMQGGRSVTALYSESVCVCVKATDPVCRSRRGSLPGIQSTAAERTGPQGDCSTSGYSWRRALVHGPEWSAHRNKTSHRLDYNVKKQNKA